jgi:hypothetical protein
MYLATYRPLLATAAPWASRTIPALPAYARLPALVSPCPAHVSESETERQSRRLTACFQAGHDGDLPPLKIICLFGKNYLDHYLPIWQLLTIRSGEPPMPAITDRMIYLCSVAHQSGDYLPERDVADLDRASTIKDIATGQIDDLVQVIECNPVEGTCRDVTGDIARDVVNVWANEAEPLRDWQYTFVEMFVSKQAADSFRRAA